ncbi:MAG: hypothetical protein AAFW83_06740 [Pseudomonadota bacterium]
MRRAFQIRSRKAIFIGLLSSCSVTATATAQEIAGTYNSTYGELRLVEKDGVVFGDYADRGVIVASREGTNLDGYFVNFRGDRVGSVQFRVFGGGASLGGEWKWVDGTTTSKWTATRQDKEIPELKNFGNGSNGRIFEGSWDTNYGDIKLVSSNGAVAGLYGNRGIIYGSGDGTKYFGSFTNAARLGNVNFSGSQTKLRGSWYWKGNDSSRTSAWNGTRKGQSAPAKKTAADDAPAGGPTKATYILELPHICVQKVDDWGLSGNNEDVFGGASAAIIGRTAGGKVKAVYVDRFPKQYDTQTEGFVRFNGMTLNVKTRLGIIELKRNVSRIWSSITEEAGYYGIGEKSCNRNMGITRKFSIDAKDFGYSSIPEFEKKSEAEFILSAMMFDADGAGPIETVRSQYLGERFVRVPLKEFPVCGACRNGRGTKTNNWKVLTGRRPDPNGPNGVLGPFSPKNANANSANVQLHYNLERQLK